MVSGFISACISVALKLTTQSSVSGNLPEKDFFPSTLNLVIFTKACVLALHHYSFFYPSL